MRYVTIGVILTVIGIAMFVSSLIPIPSVTYVPVTTPLEESTYTTVRKVWLEEEFVIPAGEAKCYCGSFPDGTLTIYIRVLSGGNRDINFWVMEEDEWTHFARGETFYYYTQPSRKRITETTITWRPPSNKRICFVYDNTFSLITSKNVYTKITIEYQTYTVTRTYTTKYVPEIKPYTLSFLVVPGIILFIVGIGLIIGGMVSKRKIESME